MPLCPTARRLTFIDLFSGAGGMSFGFHAHPAFEVIAAFDGEFGKPSSGRGSLGCNETFKVNTGLSPTAVDLSVVEEEDIERFRAQFLDGADVEVLSACPPCTGFSRANPINHLEDDHRNSLVFRTEKWVRVLRPRVLVMENARELLKGNFSYHFRDLKRRLEEMGYDVHASTHMLQTFGLPQRRERALVVATNLPIGAKGLEALWAGFEVNSAATNVRRCIAHLPAVAAGERHLDDWFHVSPSMNAESLARTSAVPRNGGSWIDLRAHPDADRLLTPSMKRYIAAKDLGAAPLKRLRRMLFDQSKMAFRGSW